MNILIVLAHPNKTSFNHAIADKARETLTANGHTVIFHDLYKEGFVPSLPGEEIPREADLPDDIARHCRETAEADGIIVVHPNWWGMPPALLKGWVDRIMRPGLAYEFEEGDNGEGVPVGLLKAEKAMVFNTSNTFEERENRVFGDPLERIWRLTRWNAALARASPRPNDRTLCSAWSTTCPPPARRQWPPPQSGPHAPR